MSFSPWSKFEYANALRYIVYGCDVMEERKPLNLVDYIDYKIKIKKYNPPKGECLWWFNELKCLFESAKKIGTIRNIIIHGSYGDNTNTNFSDVDLTVLISDDVFNNETLRQLTKRWITKELNPFLVTVDPLQHHGAFFLWEGLVNNYNEMILPLASYQESWALEDLLLKFRVSEYPNTKEQYISYVTTASRLLEPEKYFFKYGINPYSIKRLISNYLLIPAFYYQSQGIILNKSEAIYRIKEENRAESLINQGIIRATSLRDEWPKAPVWLGRVRKRTVKEQIPGNKVDSMVVNIYRNKVMESQFKSGFLKILPAACQEFLKMEKL